MYFNVSIQPNITHSLTLNLTGLGFNNGSEIPLMIYLNNETSPSWITSVTYVVNSVNISVNVNATADADVNVNATNTNDNNNNNTNNNSNNVTIIQNFDDSSWVWQPETFAEYVACVLLWGGVTAGIVILVGTFVSKGRERSESSVSNIINKIM